MYSLSFHLTGSEKKTRTPDERVNWCTAIHEAGHTIVGMESKTSVTDVYKVTIKSRGGNHSLGHVSVCNLHCPYTCTLSWTRSLLWCYLSTNNEFIFLFIEFMIFFSYWIIMTYINETTSHLLYWLLLVQWSFGLELFL